MIVIAGTVRVRREQRDQAARAALDMMEATRAEPGCLEYRFSTDLADPDTVCIFERWTDEAALAAHFASAHMATFRKRLPDLLAGPTAMQKYYVERVSPM